MADTYSSALKLRKIEAGGYDPDWSTRFNADVVDIVDAAVDGQKTISIGSSTSYSLAALQSGTLSDSHYWWLVFTGTPASAVTVTVPASVTTKEYLVDNQTGQAMTIKYAATTGVTVQNGDQLRVLCNGTTVIESPAPPRFKTTAAEITAVVTPANYGYEPGDSRRQAITNDSSTDHTSALQDVIDAAAGIVPVHIYKTLASGYIKLTGRITAPAGTHVILHDGVELRWTATAATGSTFLGSATRPGIEVTGDNFTLEGYGTLTGPSSASYVANEACLFAKGTSTSARKSGFALRGSIEIKNWGAYGVLAQFVDNIDIQDARVHIHGIGYAGCMFASCNHGRIRKILAGDITPGTAGNAYGISLNHDSTSYSSDPNAGTKSATNPFCWDWVVEGCTVYDVPLWRGIDAHGAYEAHFRGNNVYNCGLPIGLSSSSGDAIDYAGSDNSVVGNKITSKRRDGSATQVTTNVSGIIVNGGTSTPHARVSVLDNLVDGYGNTANTWHPISATYCTDAVIRGNQITNWAGRGIYTFGGNGIISGNTFGPLSSATSSVCIRLDATSSGEWSVVDNHHNPLTGTTAAEGLRISSGHPRCIVKGNEFDIATTPYAGSANLLTKGDSNPIPRMQVTGTPTTIDVGPLGQAPLAFIELSTGVTTVTDLTNATVGSTYLLKQGASNNFTLDRTNAALPGGANAVLGQYDSIVLLCVATSAPKFVALGPANANS